MLDRTTQLKSYQTYIDGRWTDAASGKTFQTFDPYTAQPWALIPECDKVDVDIAVEAASRAFESGPWTKMTPSARGKIMRRIAQLIEQHAEHLGQVEVRDNGKLISEMVAQTKYMPEWFYYYGGLADKIQGAVVSVDRPDHFNYILREPVGVCAFITPWNSPLMLIDRRIHAIVRRSKGHAQSVIQTGDLVVSLDTKTVEVNGARVHLTRKEYQLLELLSLRKGTTLTKEMILNHLYGGMDEPELKIIDVFICKLRKKLANASNGKNYIETVWGRGYVLCEPVETQGKNPGVNGRRSVQQESGVTAKIPSMVSKPLPHWYLRQRFLAVTSTNNALIDKQYVTPLLVRGRRSYFFETISNAVKRLDHVEVNVACPELLAQSLDVAVDRPVVHIALFAIGYIHQGVAAFYHPRPARQRLQDEKFGNGENHRFVLPGAGMSLRVDTQFSAFQSVAIGFPRRNAVLGHGPAQ